jgi:hypothetical protein
VQETENVIFEARRRPSRASTWTVLLRRSVGRDAGRQRRHP